MTMKKVLSIMAALAVTGFAVNCLGDAAVMLNNYDLNRPIYYQAAGTLAPVGTMIQVFGGATDASTPLGAEFGLTEPGFFDNGFGTVTGVADNENVALKLVAKYLDTSATAAWSQKAGANPPAPTLPTPAALELPADITMTAEIPEPSTIALALLGGSLLFLRRRS
jgi:hypothetical protein